MSKNIDQNIVEMRFDNRQFEQNVKTSMSTLDKLKQSLKMDNAANSFDKINTAAKNVNLESIAAGVQALQDRFSTFGIVGMRVIENVTDSVMRLGSRMLSFVANGIKNGGIARAMNLENAHFQLQGLLKDEKAVTAVMQNVNDAVDGTAYSLDAAASVASQLAASGMKAGDDMFHSLRAVAGVAAMTNSSYEDIGRIFTQVAGQGRLMGDQLLQLSGRGMNAAATLAKYLGKSESEVRDMVSKGKIDFQTFADAMDSTFGEHAKKANETLKGAFANMKSALGRIGAEFVSPLIVQNGPLVKLLNTLRERINDIKANIGPLANLFVNAVTKMANGLSNFLSKLDFTGKFKVFYKMWSPWEMASKSVEEAGISLDKFKKDLLKTAGVTYKTGKITNTFNKALKDGTINREVIVKTLKQYTGATKEQGQQTEDLTKKLKKFQKIVGEVWRGDYGNGQKRVEALTKAGYKYSEVQELVNKCVDGYKLKLSDLNAEQLKSIGYTDDQVNAIQKLAKEAETSGSDFNELIESLSKPSGKELMLETMNKQLSEFSKIAKAAKDAFHNVFGGGNVSESIYKVIEYVHDLAESFTISEKSAKNFQRVFEGAFSAVQLGWKITGLGLKTFIDLLTAVLRLFGTDILTVVANLADLITGLNNWLKNNTVLYGSVSSLAKIIHAFGDGIYRCVKAFIDLDVVGDTIKKFFTWIAKKLGFLDFKGLGSSVDNLASMITKFFDGLEARIKKLDLEDFNFNVSTDSFKSFIDYVKKSLPTLDDLQKVFEKIRDAFSKFFKWIGNLKDSKTAGQDIVEGIAKGIKSGFSSAIEAIKNLGNKIIEAFCKLLGIHSPSTVFIAIGGFIIAGLIAGLISSSGSLGSSIKDIIDNMFDITGDGIQNGIAYILGLIKNLFSSILEGLGASQIDFGSLIVIGSLISAFVMMRKLLTVMDKFSGVVAPFKALAGVFNGITNVLNQFSKNLQAKRFSTYAEGIKSIAIALSLLVGAFYLLTKIDTDKIWPALGVMAALVAQMTLLMLAASKLEPTAFARMSLFMVGMSVAVLIMAKAIRKLTEVEFGDAMKAVLEIGLLIGMLAGLMYVYGTFVRGEAAKNIDKAAKLIAKLSLSIGLMALVFKLIGSLSESDINKGLFFTEGIVVLYAGIIAISKFSGENADKAARLIGKMGLAIVMMALAIKMIASMSSSDIAKGLFTITRIEILFAGIIFVSLFAGENGAKAGRMLLTMSIAISVLAISIKIIASIPAGDIQKGMGVIKMAMQMFIAFMIMSNFVGQNAGKAGLMLLGISAAILIMVATIKLVNLISPGEIFKGMSVIAAFEAMIAALIYVSQYAGKNADKAGKMLIKMSLSILIMVGAIALLSLIKPERVALATVAIDSIMLCFIALIEVLKKSKFSKDLTKNMIIMAATIGTLAGIIGLLAQLNPQNVLVSAGSLSILLLSLATSMLILTNVKVSAKTVGIAALMGLVLAELVGVLWLIDALNIEPSIQKSLGLVTLLISMTVVMGFMGALGIAMKVAGQYIALGIAGFGIYIAELAGVLAALGGLYRIPGLNDLISDGGKLLQSIGTAIGQLVGGVVAGVAQGATSTLPEIGKSVSEFWNNIKPFVNEVKNIDESTIKGMKSLASAIFVLTGTSILDKLTSWITGESSLADFATELVTFGIALKAFAMETKGIDGESLKGATEAAKSLTEMANAIPKSGGLAGLLMGGKDLGDFGKEIVSFGKSLADYAKSVSSIRNIEGVKASVEVAKALADMSQHLPTIGGFWSKVVGEVDLAKFGKKLVPFGESITDFADNLEGFNESDAETIKCAAKAIKAMANAGGEIDGQAGWAKKLFGDDSIGAFSDSLCGVGTDLKLFANSLGAFTDEQVKTVKCAANAIKAMAHAGSEIDGQSKWAKKLFGDNGIGTFSTGLGSVAKNLKSFVTNLGTFSEEQVTTVNYAVKAIKAFTGLANANLGDANVNLPIFSAKLPSFAKNISSFCSNMPDSESVKNATKNVRSIANMVKKVAESKVGSVANFTKGLGNMAKSGVKAFADTFNSEKSAASASKAVSTFVSNAAKGIRSKKKTFQDAAKALSSAGVSAIKTRTQYNAWHGAGVYVVEGFANGILDNKSKAIKAAKEVGRAAKEAMRKELDERSPSKEFYKIGDFAGLGFVNGLSGYVDKAYDVSSSVAKSAKDGLNNAIKRIKNFVNEGVEVNPTISPVLDLSNVDSGVRAMNAMLDMGETIGLSTDVGVVSSMMNRRIQNGMNNDVVSAINKLAGKLGNIGGDSYTINGITYDDGSNVSDAVKTLVRAAKVERRV